jgi:hypothetical protein
MERPAGIDVIAIDRARFIDHVSGWSGGKGSKAAARASARRVELSEGTLMIAQERMCRTRGVEEVSRDVAGIVDALSERALVRTSPSTRGIEGRELFVRKRT